MGFVTLNADVSAGIPDHFPVPWSRWGKGYSSGVEIHATAASNILRGDYIRTLRFDIVYLISFMLCAGLIALLTLERYKLLFYSWGGTTLTLFMTYYYLFSKFNQLLPLSEIVFPTTAMTSAALCFRFLEIRNEKSFIRKAFSTYVSPQVVEELVKHPNKLELGGEEREITALFSDIQGFTAISEKMPPKELVSFLNVFLSEMSDIILAHQGTVDKFEGDAIIAFFGAPQDLKDHAQRACIACLKMQKRLVELNALWKEKDLPEIRMRVGLCTGKAIVGNMGTLNRMDYTMMGDTVNLAARLEGANKIYGIYSLISNTTRHALNTDICIREIDRIQVVGRNEPVTIYELIDFAGHISKPKSDLLEMYASGLKQYRLKAFDRAEEYFKTALSMDHKDGPSKTMLTRCRTFSETPPPPDWDTVYLQKKK